MTTQEAFEALISVRGNSQRLGLTPIQKAALAKNHRNGKVSINRMEELLRTAGFEKIIQEHWALDESKLVYNKKKNSA